MPSETFLSSTMVYFVAQADSFKYMFGQMAEIGTVISILSLAVVVIFSTLLADEAKPGSTEEKFKLGCRRGCNYIIPITIILYILTTAIPSTKATAAIYLIPAIVNNEKMQNIGSNSLQILEEYTKQFLNDLKDNVKPENQKSGHKKDL